jgi:hypothetical protein
MRIGKESILKTPCAPTHVLWDRRQIAFAFMRKDVQSDQSQRAAGISVTIRSFHEGIQAVSLCFDSIGNSIDPIAASPPLAELFG